MQTITTEQLRQWRARREDFLLINVLAADAFQKQHIPGSINIPADDDQFTRKVHQKLGSKDRKVVVYCTSKECTASPRAAKKLDKDGFSNVYDYEVGMTGWAAANLPVERAA